MICIDDNPSMAASSPRRLRQCSIPCTPGCSLALAGTVRWLAGMGCGGGIWGVPHVRDAVAYRGLQRGSCQTLRGPRVAPVGPRVSSCNAQPWSCSRGKGNPCCKPPRAPSPSGMGSWLQAPMVSLPGATWTRVLWDAHLPFQPKQRPMQIFLTSCQWPLVA